jgi:Tol biopolymer transport system component
MNLTPGTKLGPYEIIAPLGAGGMGEVYRARDTRLGREVAVKVLPQHLSASPEVRARFEREAKTVSGLNHPHICTLFDVGREGNTDYLVMELIEGETLAERIAKGPLPPADVLKLGAQIADALDRAHRAGVVHRDLKPGNVMLTKSGAKLMDFGLARATGLAGSGGSAEALTQSPTIAAPLTAEGTIVGTFQYMAPEQLEGNEADARSDIWALGCVLYEMATGKRAFEGKSQASLIAAILEHVPTPIVTLAPLSPPALDRVVNRCVAKDPEERWQSARDLAQELRWIAEGGSQAGAQAPAAGRTRGRGRFPLPWVLVAVMAVVTGVSLILALRVDRSAPRQFLFQQLAYRPAAIFRAAFAPDGKTIVYSAAPEGNVPAIFTVRPEYPEPQPLGLHDVQLLSVSSQGELAVLTHARYIGHRLFSGTLARVSLGGGAPREIFENVREADWSPDGSELAIIREVEGTDQLEYPIGHVLCQSGGYMSDLRISPQGDRIAFFEHPSRYDDRGSVDVVDLHGKKTVLSDGYWGEEGIAWTRDGSEILFSASYGGYTWTVYAVTPGGKRRVALQSAGGLTIHDVAADGRWLTTRDDQHNGVMVHKPEWKEDHDLSWLDLSNSGLLSRDGGTLVFSEQSGAMGTNYAVCLRKTDGSPVVRLGEGSPSDVSADGKWVLVEIPSTPPELAIYPTGAGTPRRLERGNLENYANALWFPDAKSILISGNLPGEGPRFFIQRVDGGPPQPATPDGTRDGFLSPDGTRVLARGPDSKYAIYPLSGGEPTPVPGMSEFDELIRWSADGRSALVYRGRDIPCRVERVDLATGRRTLFREIAPADRAGLLRILPSFISDDEKSYVYQYGRQMSSLFIVENAK